MISINDIKVAVRTGKSKNDKPWEARAIQLIDDGVKYEGLIFAKNTGISDKENIVGK